MEKTNYKTVDEYIARFSPEVQEKLQAIRNIIKEEAPQAQEKISYQMPAFTLNGALVYFAAFQKHIGFFPTPDGIEAFMDELTAYKTSKGTIQFPMDKPIPFELVRRMVRYRAAQNAAKSGPKPKQ